MVTVQFFPFDVDYTILDDKPTIRMYGHTVEGKQICVQDNAFAPYLYILLEHNTPTQILDHINGLGLKNRERTVVVADAGIIERKYLATKVKLVQLTAKFPADIPIVRNAISGTYKVFESDILYTRRYLIDKRITPMVLTDVEGEFINQKSKVSVLQSHAISQRSAEQVPTARILAIDIETAVKNEHQIDAENNPILMVGLWGDGYRKVILSRKVDNTEPWTECVESEEALLVRLKESIEEYKPDILTGYYSDGFDLPYIAIRAEKHKVRLDLGLDYSLLEVDRRGQTDSHITGIVHIDIFQFIRRIFAITLETPLYDLGSVSKELLGMTKEDVDILELWQVFSNNPKDLVRFCRYNLRDAELTYNLTSTLMPNIVELVKVVGLTPYDVTRTSYSQLVEWYLMRRAAEAQELIPNKPSHDEVRKRRSNTYPGAFVFEPQPGLYTDIVVFDFRSLYPSIISSHNISPDTLNCACCEHEHIVPGEKYWFCKKRRGFIAKVIEELIMRRMRVKEIGKASGTSKQLEARSYALKTIGNAMYGYLGFFMARWYCLECVKSITAYGRYYIGDVIDKAQKQDYKVIYGDTDSVFIVLGAKTVDDARHFAESINQDLPELMELDFEGLYPRGIFVSAKMGGLGAKKRYALLSKSGAIKIRGFETVRRNISNIAKRTQEEVLQIILKEDNAEKAVQHVRAVVSRLRHRQVPLEDVIIFTQLQKTVDQYESVGPHVAIAKRLMEKGIAVGPGTMIRYVITAKGEKIRDKAKLPEECTIEDYDPEYYINNQIIPAVEKMFEVLGHRKDELVQSDQRRLSSYFGS